MFLLVVNVMVICYASICVLRLGNNTKTANLEDLGIDED
jgi:hypothetical protein